FKKEGKIFVPAYVSMSSHLIFDSRNKQKLEDLYEILMDKADTYPLCLYNIVNENFEINNIRKNSSIEDYFNQLTSITREIMPVIHNEYMKMSKFMIGILEGSSSLDNEVASEIGFYSGQFGNSKPIIGIRGSSSLTENMDAPIYPRLRYHIDKGPNEGYFFTGHDAFDKATQKIAYISENIKNSLGYD
ncbi:MAG: hypothetical protein ACQER9_04415, partial [Nanobdellota archaeon]